MHDPQISHSGEVVNISANSRQRPAEEDFITGLARVVLERLESVEKESGLQRMRELPESQIEEETRQLIHGWDGLKDRLKWIAGGM
ncbi:MAG TPA: hypothetical protein VN426_07790 [Syntrophomonadaceae bacterium]|nr:hypothetical protein [Syntrophomonadaceae bacterium]